MKRTFALILSALFIITLYIPASTKSVAAVYVCDGGNGDGSSPLSAVGTLEKAYEILFSTTDIKNNPDAEAVIVICGKLTIVDHFNYNGKISHTGKVIYTSSFGGNDYRESADARLVIHASSKSSLSVNDEHRFLLGGPTRFENLILDRKGKTDAHLTIYTSTDFYAAESFSVLNTNWTNTYTPPFRALTDTEISSIILNAHRGFQPMDPENSVLSFEAAGRLGFDYIETDVHETSDGELVCIHDSTLDRTTNGSGKISELTYSEILKCHIDSTAYGFDISVAEPEKLYVPTFREYLEICQKYNSKPFIELKSSDSGMIKKIIETALEYFKAEDIIMSSGSLSALKTSYDLNKEIFCHLIWGDQSDSGYEKSITALAKMKNSAGKTNAGIAFNITGLSNKDNYERAKYWIDKAHASGLLTCLRGADDTDELRLMFELGIDYYPTNTTSPDKLSDLTVAKDGKYTFASADGGKLFIRGGRRSETTHEDVSITLLGGIYDFVAPSNAEAKTLGNYSVNIGGNAFVSRLVAGETAKNASDEHQSTTVTINGDAVIRELYAAGDYANTKTAEINILGGNVLNLIHSRGKGGTLCDLKMFLITPALIPTNIDISNKNVITGKKTLTVNGEISSTNEHWDEIIFISAETENENTASSSLPSTTVNTSELSVPPETTNYDNEPKSKNNYAYFVVIAVIALAGTVIFIFGRRVSKQN